MNKQDDISKVEAGNDLLKIHSTISGMELGGADTIPKLTLRIKELEAALEIKDAAVDKLKSMVSNLQAEIKNKDTMRVAQIELLALRNLELEMKLSQSNGGPPSLL